MRITLLLSNMSWIEFSQSDANLQKNNNHSIIMEIFQCFSVNLYKEYTSLKSRELEELPRFQVMSWQPF